MKFKSGMIGKEPRRKIKRFFLNPDMENFIQIRKISGED